MRWHTTGAALAVLIFLTGAVRAEEFARTIRVTGEGKAAAPPDMATIRTGVVTEAATAGEALAANNKAMEQVLAALKEFRIAPKDVQTSHFNVRPIHQRDPDGRTLPEIVAYQVTNQVRVRVRHLPDLGKVLDALVQAGSNQVSGVSFEVGDPTAVLDQARGRAIADAQHRAQLYAQAAGARVGKVRTISEQSVPPPRPLYLARDSAAQASAAVPMAPGEEEFRVQVYVVFTLQDASPVSDPTGEGGAGHPATRDR